MQRIRAGTAFALVGAACLFAPAAWSQPRGGPPRLQPVAETKLLMSGLAEPNFKGLSKLLRDKPTTAEAWTFARGRALLIAETGNLLMIRPPKDRVEQDDWMTHGTELRDAATALARAASEHDYLQSRAALAGLANACNRCHRAARVPNRVQPFPDDGKEVSP